MSFQGEMTDLEKTVKKHYLKLLDEVRRGVFSDAKFDLLITNPDEFFAEYLPNLEDEERREVVAMIKHIIMTGFWRSNRKKAMADAAERN